MLEILSFRLRERLCNSCCSSAKTANEPNPSLATKAARLMRAMKAVSSTRARAWACSLFIGAWLYTGSIGVAQAGGLPVFDGAALTETISQRIVEIEQWVLDNEHQLQQITGISDGNNILSVTQDLMDKNYAMNNKQSWQDINHLQEQTLALLYSTKSVWEEFGSASQYYAAFQKAAAWQECHKAGTCTFSDALKRLDESSIDQALQAYQSSEAMAKKLEKQIHDLKDLGSEGHGSKSQAGTIDTLTKINGSVANSLVDLNTQVSEMIKLQSHDIASKSNQKLSQDSYIREIMTYRHPLNKEELPSKLPDQPSGFRMY